jgi:hypothetical protein
MGGMPYGQARSTRPMTSTLAPGHRHAGRSARPISFRFAITEVHDAFQLALNSRAAAKVVVTFGD